MLSGIQTLSGIQNPHYSPNAFKIIEDKLHIVSLWSGLMIREFQFMCRHYEQLDSSSEFYKLTRLDNNIVECYQGHLKFNQLRLKERCQGNKLMISQIVGPIYRELHSKYLEFDYHSMLNHFEQKKQTNESIHDLEEKWKDMPKKTSREKGFYYKNTSGKYYKSRERAKSI